MTVGLYSFSLQSKIAFAGTEIS